MNGIKIHLLGSDVCWFLFGKGLGYNFCVFSKNIVFFQNPTFSLHLGSSGRTNSHTSTIVVCLVRSGPPGFWSVFVSWELNQTGIKALNLSKKGIGLVIFQWCICIYIAYFLANWKSMKRISHRFFPFSQKQLLKKTFNRRPMNCQPLRTADLKMWKDSRKSAAKILSPFTCLRWFFAKTGKPKTVWL